MGWGELISRVSLIHRLYPLPQWGKVAQVRTISISPHLLALVHQVLKALESNFNLVHTRELICIQ